MTHEEWIWRGVSFEIEPTDELAPYMDGNITEYGVTTSRNEELAREERLVTLEEEVKALGERIAALKSEIMTPVS